LTVSIIITVYNHAEFLHDAIHSAKNQSLVDKEIIIIDNGSKDKSKEKIEAILLEYPDIQFLAFEKPINYCKAFNTAFQKSKGDYIIDLSADDILLSNFAEKTIEEMKSLTQDYGVVFCNAEYIDEKGKYLKYHFPLNAINQTLLTPPSGNIYSDLLERFIISAPTMMIKRSVLEGMNGYDEHLVYEDFDFWIRSSRNWKYKYLDFVGVKVRKHKNNYGRNFYKKNQNDVLWSTFKVCLKAKKLNKNEIENLALHKRSSYHLRQAVLTEHFALAKKYFALISSISKPSFLDYIFLYLAYLQWPVYPFYKLFIRNH
jgi:glycosyltransferase involved in cell wall biosynthesis